MKSADLITQKVELVGEAIDDYRKGELTDLACLAAIGAIANARSVDPGAIEWAKKVFMKGDLSCVGGCDDDSCVGC
jgi:hypothetical protein